MPVATSASAVRSHASSVRSLASVNRGSGSSPHPYTERGRRPSAGAATPPRLAGTSCAASLALAGLGVELAGIKRLRIDRRRQLLEGDELLLQAVEPVIDRAVLRLGGEVGARKRLDVRGLLLQLIGGSVDERARRLHRLIGVLRAEVVGLLQDREHALDDVRIVLDQL